VRYQDLLAALFIVATASWIWAQPSEEVRLPSSTTVARPSSSSQGSRPDPRPDQTPQQATPSRPNPLSWSNYQSSEFALKLDVTPGQDLASTTFDVTFTGPRGFDLAKDGGSGSHFALCVDRNSALSLHTDKARRTGSNSWRFQGSDLQRDDGQAGLPEIHRRHRIEVTTLLSDEKQSRFSRGANVMLLRSQPAVLTLR
jgi:hypothetical protein